MKKAELKKLVKAKVEADKPATEKKAKEDKAKLLAVNTNNILEIESFLKTFFTEFGGKYYPIIFQYKINC